MKKSVLLFTSVVVAALGILSYTFLYASSGAAGDKDCASACSEAGAAHGAAMTGKECPFSAKAAGDEGCAEKMSAAKADGSCEGHAKMCDGKAKEQCMKSKASDGEAVEENEAISID